VFPRLRHNGRPIHTAIEETFMGRECRVAAALVLVACSFEAAADEGEVSWSDPTCGYFVVRLPEGNPAEAYGLFSVKGLPLPNVGDVLEGDIVSAQEPTLNNRTKNVSHDVIHWANAREQVMLVRNTPVQCASRWKKKR
jgi:hypothetical protein